MLLSEKTDYPIHFRRHGSGHANTRQRKIGIRHRQLAFAGNR